VREGVGALYAVSKAVDGTGAVEKVVAVVNEVRRVPTKLAPTGNQIRPSWLLRLRSSLSQARLRLGSG